MVCNAPSIMLKMQSGAPHVSPHLAEMYPGMWLGSEDLLTGNVATNPGRQVESGKTIGPAGDTKHSQATSRRASV